MSNEEKIHLLGLGIIYLTSIIEKLDISAAQKLELNHMVVDIGSNVCNVNKQQEVH